MTQLIIGLLMLAALAVLLIVALAEALGWRGAASVLGFALFITIGVVVWVTLTVYGLNVVIGGELP